MSFDRNIFPLESCKEFDDCVKNGLKDTTSTSIENKKHESLEFIQRRAHAWISETVQIFKYLLELPTFYFCSTISGLWISEDL